jgi:hypothetical protein
MESNLLAVAFICWIQVTRAQTFQPEAIASFVAKLCEVNVDLVKLAPNGTRTPGGIWLKEEEILYSQAQNLVTTFSRNSGLAMALYYNADVPTAHPGSQLRLALVGTSRDERQPYYLQADSAVVAASLLPSGRSIAYARSRRKRDEARSQS